jgi:hypothetical protein
VAGLLGEEEICMPDSAQDVRMSARAGGVLLVICGAIFLEGVDVAMLNVALPVVGVVVAAGGRQEVHVGRRPPTRPCRRGR